MTPATTTLNQFTALAPPYPQESARQFKQMASEFYGITTLFRNTPQGVVGVVLFASPADCAAFLACRARC